MLNDWPQVATKLGLWPAFLVAGSLLLGRASQHPAHQTALERNDLQTERPGAANRRRYDPHNWLSEFFPSTRLLVQRLPYERLSNCLKMWHQYSMDAQASNVFAESNEKVLRRTLRRVVFLGIASFILLVPAMPQIFGIHHALFRPWVMYSGVGTGILKGEFTVRKLDGTIVALTPREILNIPRYPLQMQAGQFYQVYSVGDLKRVSQGYCSKLSSGETLAFHGSFSTAQGWTATEDNDICRVNP